VGRRKKEEGWRNQRAIYIKSTLIRGRREGKGNPDEMIEDITYTEGRYLFGVS